MSGKLLAAKNLPKSATYTTKEVFDDWRAHGWKGSLADARDRLGGKKPRKNGDGA